MVAGRQDWEAPPVFRMIAPPDGGWSLTPIESLLRGLRNIDEKFALELCGWSGGAVSYLLRSYSGARIQGLLQSYYPQARGELIGEGGKGVHSDWLRLASDEKCLLLPLHLAKESFLPLLAYGDDTLRQSESDPLSGVVGQISGLGRWTGGVASDRLGLRLLLHPAPEDWAKRYQSRIQARRDGDDRIRQTGGSGQVENSNTGIFALGALLLLLGVGYLNWTWFQEQEFLKMLALDGGGLAAGLGGLFALARFGGKASRKYLDEELVENKLKSLAFHAELQLVRVYRGGPAERGDAVNSLHQFVDVMRQFDNPAGNAWKTGKIVEFSGLDLDHAHGGLALAAPQEAFAWRSGRRARHSILSAREVATLWHMPLGIKDAASIERSQSVVLTPLLEGLDEEGPLVGHTEMGHPIRFPESALKKHTVLLGRSGSGKSTLIKHFLYYKMQAKARGEDDGAIVLIDPHADLVRDVLRVVPPAVAHKVRLLDLGDDARVPSINLLDPELSPDRDRCVGTIIETLKHLWPAWGNRLEEILDRGLKAIYEYNSHPDTPRTSMLTILDLLRLLQDGKPTGTGRDARVQWTPFQEHVFSRVHDAYVRLWFEQLMNLPRDARAEGMGPVMNRIGAFAGNNRSKVVMGMRESTVVFSDILKDGIILLVSTASGSVGAAPAALMGGTIVSLVDSALREQERLPFSERKTCLLIADEFQTITGTNWAGMFAEVRKYGCSVMLATQSLAVLDRGGSEEPSLKSGIMSNVGCLISYAISAEDAYLVSHQMGAERVTETDLVLLDPYHCYVRLTTSDKSLPTFSLKTAPPPELQYGNEASVQMVRDLMYDYTVDRGEALRKINAEAVDALWGDADKIGADGKKGFASREPAGSGVAVQPPKAAGAANLYSMVMTGAKSDSPAQPAAAVSERIGAAAVKNSAFAPEVLEQLLKVSDKDEGVRGMLDVRLQGKVRRAMADREKEFKQELASREAELASREQELERLRTLLNEGSSANAAGSSGAADGGAGANNGVVSDQPPESPPERESESERVPAGGTSPSNDTAQRNVSALRSVRPVRPGRRGGR